MRWLFMKKFWLFVFALSIILAGAGLGYMQHMLPSDRVVESTTVSLGTIVQTVIASGKIDVDQLTRLGFAVPGTIQQVYFSVGDQVAAGDVIASLTSDALVAEYDAVLERVRAAKEQRAELLRGAPMEERAVAEKSTEVAVAALASISLEYEQAIRNARQQLLSNDLRAYPVDVTNDDTPPSISGSYLCEEEGLYLLSLFGSRADANVSYVLSGLGSGKYPGNKTTPEPLGDCGLYIQFDAAEAYRSTDWQVPVPNKRSPSYVMLQSAYDLLVAQRDAALQSAQEELALAEENERLVNAGPVTEVLAQATAWVAEAESSLAQQAARIADYTIRAPFAGVVSEVAMRVGEPAGLGQTVTIVQEGEYELLVQVPEIDITKVMVGDRASVIFDAEPTVEYLATVSCVSPVSTDVTGVSYYETTVMLDTEPVWLREGLNADVRIEVERIEDVLVLPDRYVVKTGTTSLVWVDDGVSVQQQVVSLGVKGSDGLVEIEGVPVGARIVLP